MSAQPSQHVTTRVLIAEKSENAAHELDSTLRDAGIATQLSISDDAAHIAKILADGEADIALITDKIEGLDTLLPRMRENAPHTPLLLITNGEETTWDITNALSKGATDLVPSNCPQQIALVVLRELEHVCQRNHTSQLRRALKEAEERCQLLLQGSKAAIAYIHEGMHIHANECYLSLFGFSDVDDLCSASLVDLLDSKSVEELKTHLKALRGGEEERVFEFDANPDLESSPSGSMTLTHAQYEGEACYQVTVRTGQAEAAPTQETKPSEEPAAAPSEQELGLPGFVRAAETLFNSSTGENYVFCVGLDHFSQTQQAYGLLGAETIARKVWIQLDEIIDEFPMVKLSTHQFAIAVSASSISKAQERADAIRKSICDLILEVQDKTVRPTVSVAAAELNEEFGLGACLDEAYANLLDLAEKEAANATFMPSIESEEEDENGDARVILRQITHAIENKMFQLLYQPIISLRGDGDEHYEVFLRMLNDEGEQIEPGRFLQTAIDNNVAGKIDRWVILQSIKMLSVHRAKGNTTRLTINLTANSVVDREFPQWLGVAMKAARLPSDAVIFQITEKDATTYLRQTREFVEKLRSMHCRAALSRFGLIEDPFETLRHIPVDMVKIDGSSITEVETDSEQRSGLIDMINQLQNSGKLTVVPMVENANILSTLWQAGANYIQGHYLQEPSTEMDYDFSTEE